MTVYAELGKVFKLKQKGNESYEDFATRATDRVGKVTDAEWKELSNDLQVWCNETLEAREKKTDLPELVGWPSDETAGAEGEESSDEEATDTEESTADDDSENADDATDKPEDAEEKAGAKAKAIPRKQVAEKKKGKPVKAPKVAKPVKAAKAASTKPAKAAKAKSSNGAGRTSNIDPTSRIKLLVKENPHREGTGRYKRWGKYKNNMTVAEALKAGLNLNNLRYSMADKHIKIE